MEMLDKHIDKLDIENKEKFVFEILESDSIGEYQILDDFISKIENKVLKLQSMILEQGIQILHIFWKLDLIL